MDALGNASRKAGVDKVVVPMSKEETMRKIAEELEAMEIRVVKESTQKAVEAENAVKEAKEAEAIRLQRKKLRLWRQRRP